MPPQAPKQRVRAAFERAADTYDAAAVLQKEVCTALLADLAPLPENAKVLDAGCGTGYGARLLRARWPSANIVAADFAPAMLALARQSSDVCCAADIETLPFAERSFDLWWSSLSIQWCAIDRALAEAFRVLRAGGRLALSTLAPATFHELRTAFAAIDGYRHTLRFNESAAIGAALTRAGFGEIALRHETRTLHYPDLKTLLRAVKAIGANTVGAGARSGMMGRVAWQALEAAYERQRTAAGLPVSYEIVLAYAGK
jgi:malonyl-CoA O-methyltransferase